jgi:hypothetical protein
MRHNIVLRLSFNLIFKDFLIIYITLVTRSQFENVH